MIQKTKQSCFSPTFKNSYNMEIQSYELWPGFEKAWKSLLWYSHNIEIPSQMPCYTVQKTTSSDVSLLQFISKSTAICLWHGLKLLSPTNDRVATYYPNVGTNNNDAGTTSLNWDSSKQILIDGHFNRKWHFHCYLW